MKLIHLCSPDGVVHTAVGEQIGPQWLFLDFPIKKSIRTSTVSKWDYHTGEWTKWWTGAVYANLTSISRTLWISGNRSQTLLFIFSLMMKEWQVRQSPIFMALLAATTCSLMLSGGPGGQIKAVVILSVDETSCYKEFSWCVSYLAGAVSPRPWAGDGTACWSSGGGHQTHGRPCRVFPAAWLTPGTHTPAAPGWCACGMAPVKRHDACVYHLMDVWHISVLKIKTQTFVVSLQPWFHTIVDTGSWRRHGIVGTLMWGQGPFREKTKVTRTVVMSTWTTVWNLLEICPAAVRERPKNSLTHGVNPGYKQVITDRETNMSVRVNCSGQTALTCLRFSIFSCSAFLSCMFLMSKPWPSSSLARPEDWMSSSALWASLIMPCLNAQMPSWTIVLLYRIW